MSDFNKFSLFQKRRMAIDELANYYAEYRKYEYDSGKSLKGIELRKKMHFLIEGILKLDQLLSKENIVILNDKHTVDNDTPKIFACIHIGGNDVQRAFQVLGTPAYLMLGDPGYIYRMPIYQALKLNGVIPLETKNREDRKIAYNRSVELLNNNGNLLIFPEGAWNVSPNLVVMKLFSGAVRMAQETGAEIVPIAVEQYDNKFYFNIGENYSIPNNTEYSIQELTDDLRDKLSTLKWEIFESQPQLVRDNVPNNYLDTFQNRIVERCNFGYGLTIQDALDECFHDKTITEPDEVFSFLDDLELGKNNAFLAKDKIKTKTKKFINK